MIAGRKRQDGADLVLDHYRAARVVMDELGTAAEQAILQHINRMIAQNDNESAHLWRCVLAAYDEMQIMQPGGALLH
jgi:hypothetical protein